MSRSLSQSHTLLRHDERLAVVRLGPGADLPDWAGASSVFSVTATAAETSLVCARAAVPRKVPQAGPYTAFSLRGPVDLALTGVLAGLLTPLAEAQVPVFAVSTFDTDWVLVPTDDADRAVQAWTRAGHAVEEAGQP